MGSLGTAGRVARHIMKYLGLCLVLQIGGGHAWCGYLGWMQQPKRIDDYDVPHPGIAPVEPQEYTIHDKTLTFLMNDEMTSSPPAGLNLSTGIFTAPTSKSYLVTLTAQIANSGNNKLFSYAQLFILKNKNLESLENYLLVEQNKVGDLRVEVDMERGDTLEVFLGHHIKSKYVFGSSGVIDRYDGFFLEDVRFCIF